MKIFRPTISNWKTQDFGESTACINKFNKVVGKTNGVCPPGYEDLYKKVGMKGHNGEDWGLWKGEPIYFPVDSNLEWKAQTEVDYAGGIGVDVISTKEVLIPDVGQKGLVKNHPDGYFGFIKLRFWHLEKVNVYDGQKINFGDVIGFGDSTGLSSGHHLHWSMKMCDVTGRGINKNNGYYGALDFDSSHYDPTKSVVQILKLKVSLLQQIYFLIQKVKLLLG